MKKLIVVLTMAVMMAMATTALAAENYQQYYEDVNGDRYIHGYNAEYDIWYSVDYDEDEEFTYIIVDCKSYSNNAVIDLCIVEHTEDYETCSVRVSVEEYYTVDARNTWRWTETEEAEAMDVIVEEFNTWLEQHNLYGFEIDISEMR